MYRKGVAAIILNDKNQILLVNLKTFDSKSFSIPGGGSEEGESDIDTLKRELLEELGIESSMIEVIKKSSILYKFNFKSITIKDGKKYKGQEKVCFLVKYNGTNKDIKISKEEIRKYVWSDYKDLDKYLLFEEQLESIQFFIKDLCPYIIKI